MAELDLRKFAGTHHLRFSLFRNQVMTSSSPATRARHRWWHREVEYRQQAPRTHRRRG